MLLVIGIPLIAFKTELPGWLESGAEKAVGVVIIVLALRVGTKWARGDYRAASHEHHGGDADDAHAARLRHLRKGSEEHSHRHVRSPQQAFAIGTLHGLAGTGAVALLLIAALPTHLEAALALAVFAPMSIASDGAVHGGVCVGAHAAGDRAALPDRGHSVPRRFRVDVRALVHGAHLAAANWAAADAA